MLLSALAVIVVLSPIVIIHEFGHFIACRLTGIGVKEFSFGFGKILWHKKSSKGTDFQIRAIPFGGFVEPEGQMFPEEGATEKPKEIEGKELSCYDLRNPSDAIVEDILRQVQNTVISQSTKESKIQYLDGVSKMTE